MNRDDLYQKLLGLNALDSNNLPLTTPNTGSRRGVYQPKFDFSQGQAYSGDDKNAVIYRGDTYYEDVYKSQKRNALIGNTIGRTIGSIIPKIGEAAGMMADFNVEVMKSLVDVFTPGDTFKGNAISRATDNTVSEIFAKSEDWMKGRLPGLSTGAYDNATSFWDKAGTSTFWVNDVSDGLAFMISALVPGAALSKLGAGAKALKLAAASGLLKGGGEQFALTLPKILRGVNTVDAVTT